MLTEATASGVGRKLTHTGDVLGTLYKPTAPSVPEQGAPVSKTNSTFIKTKEIQDHVHFYSAATVLTQWAETTFALSAQAHAKLIAQPSGSIGSACVYDGSQCLLNPLLVSSAGFPAPDLQVERILKRFALEAFMCRGASDRPNCHLDPNCDWDDLTGACFLSHDPHSEFTQAIAPCRDMLYTAAAAACWRREPELESFRPCGSGACRLYKAGSGASWDGAPGGSGGGGAAGLPEDRCMPDVAVGTSAAPPRLKPLDMYALLKRHFGSSRLPSAQLVNATALEAAAGGGEGEGAVPAVEGFGRCSTAALHHTMKTTCRTWSREACLKDRRCGWMSGIVAGSHCVLSRDTVIDVLMGSSPFTKAVRKAEASCRAISSADACGKAVMTI